MSMLDNLVNDCGDDQDLYGSMRSGENYHENFSQKIRAEIDRPGPANAEDVRGAGKIFINLNKLSVFYKNQCVPGDKIHCCIVLIINRLPLPFS